MSNPKTYRHPAGRTCGGIMATWTAIIAVLLTLARRAAR